MTDIWMVTNSASGSYDAERSAALAERLGVTRQFVLPEDMLPTDKDAKGVQRIILFAGDGTVSAAVEALSNWSGELLVLPGGTMNLLSRKLHGETGAEEIVERVLSRKATIRKLPMTRGCGHRSLVGVIAGPTTAWGDVREDMRNLDLRSLSESVPLALKETLGGQLVSIKGRQGDYQAIFIDALDNSTGGTLQAQGVSAANAGELAQHGLAWLSGNFLGGPSEILGKAKSFTIEGAQDVGLLVDGERAQAKGPCTFKLGHCPLRFLATA